MDKLVFLAGIASTGGGICLIVYQALIYLMHNTWNQYTLMTLIENGPDSLWEWVDMMPNILSTLESIPLFAALIVVGIILLLVGSKLKNLYS
jgi:hypothetical protein